MGLNTVTPIARNTDPVTSHLAAQEVTARGYRGKQQHIALKAVRDFPSRTSRELAFLANEDRYMMARRLPELENIGLVKKGPARMCEIGKRKAVVWVPNVRTH